MWKKGNSKKDQIIKQKDLSVYDVLAELQQNSSVKKDIDNDFGGFKYRKLPQVIEHIKPILKTHNAFLTFETELVAHLGNSYVQSTVTLHAYGGVIISNGFAREKMSDKKMSEGQLTGSAITYSRKYALDGLILTDEGENDPDDVKQTGTSEVQKKAQKKMSNESFENMKKLDPSEFELNYQKYKSIMTDEQKAEAEEIIKNNI